MNKQIKSGDYCKCDSCGHIGYVYGIAHSKGISAPFCYKCGVNDKLKTIKDEIQIRYRD